MPFIKILPSGLINKIQAGEVVERPASVVKELIENSIDAGSTQVDVEITHAGRGIIRVSDNGSGMDKEDALLSLKRHATSKILSENDLFSIKSMGFRGEALPSIASVSRLHLITAPKGITEGISIDVEGGEIKAVKDAASLGTTIEVKDIFFNTPPRKKFLKSNTTELTHIIDALTRLSFSHPEIGFSLKTDGNEVMSLPKAEGAKERLMQVYGMEFLSGLVEISAGRDSIAMHAFVSKKDSLRQRRSHQYIFINKRPVREQSISHAIYSAYEGMPGTNRHPIYFVFIAIDPKVVDFNVHPTKQEVRFVDKEAIYRFIKGAVGSHIIGDVPSMSGAFETQKQACEWQGLYPESQPQGTPYKIAEALPFGYNIDLPFIYLGDTFIAFPGNGGLMLMDFHAAHERILYERLLKGIGLESHELLFPKQVKLSPKEYMVILRHKELLSGLGMGIEDFGHDTVLIRSLPEAVMEADLQGILSDAAAEILDSSKPMESIKEAVSARIACHSSVRGKHIFNQESLKALINDLEGTGHPETCPHGRPTRIFYSSDELKKIFKRK